MSSNWRRLLQAARDGDATVIEEELALGADINQRGGCSPLMMACRFRHLHCIKLLIERKCDVAASDSGCCAIHFATRAGFVDVAELLLDAKADINSQVNFLRGSRNALACCQFPCLLRSL